MPFMCRHDVEDVIWHRTACPFEFASLFFAKPWLRRLDDEAMASNALIKPQNNGGNCRRFRNNKENAS